VRGNPAFVFDVSGLREVMPRWTRRGSCFERSSFGAGKQRLTAKRTDSSQHFRFGRGPNQGSRLHLQSS
jgi:hypothetical protein